MKWIKKMQSISTANDKQTSARMAFSILHRSRCVSVAVLQCCTAGEEDRPCSPRDPRVLVGSRSDLIGLSAAASPATTTHINTRVYTAALSVGLCLVLRTSSGSRQGNSVHTHTHTQRVYSQCLDTNRCD